MKIKVILLPLLVFGNIVNAQFNTASFKENINSVEVSEFSENHFSSSFVTYHIQGNQKTKKNEEENVSSEKIVEEPVGKDLKEIENGDLLDNENIVEYKKINPINFPTRLERQYKQYVYMPLGEIAITSNYGLRYHPIDKVYKSHNGIDLRAKNEFVYAVLDGVVSASGFTANAGNYIKIKHGDFETIYLHLTKYYYKTGDVIAAGDIIALSGNTGKSTAPHLHFAVKENGKYINPIDFLNTLINTNNTIIDYENNRK